MHSLPLSLAPASPSLSSFGHRYTRLSDVVDQMFPPPETAKEEDFLSEYTSFNYWKKPIHVISDGDELLTSLLEPK